MSGNAPLVLIPLELKSPPESYSSSLKARTSISLAASGHFNPRRLEAMYNGPWTEELGNLSEPYGGDLILIGQYPLFLSSVIVLEQKLRQDYAAHGVAYQDNPDDVFKGFIPQTGSSLPEADQYESDSDDSDDNVGRDDHFVPTRVVKASVRSIPPRLSTRLKDNEAQRKVEERNRRSEIRKDLRCRKKALKKLQKVYEKREAKKVWDTNDPLDFDNSVSIESSHDGKALDWAPDFVLCHVKAYQLPESQKHTNYFVVHAGVKISHHCCALIAEIKTPPEQRGYLQFYEESLDDAQLELMEYCAAYFLGAKESASVAALAACGGVWNWATIHRDDVPEFDWSQKALAKGIYDPMVHHFQSKFGPAFWLGSAESDKELLKISTSYLYSSLTDGHEDN